MRSRWARLLLAALLATVLAAAASGTPRAEAAVYWGSGGFVGAANLDGSNFVDGVPYGLSNVPEIGDDLWCRCGWREPLLGGPLPGDDRADGARLEPDRPGRLPI